MNKLNFLAAGFAVLAFSTPAANAHLRINEVMQSNVHGIMDDLNDFPDSWVELYNDGSQAVNLADYALSVKDKASKAYKLPSQTVNPGEFVLIYCDKVGDGFHADFRVDSGKGDLYLWNNDEKLESLSLKKMPAPDIAYGRLNETSDEWGYQAVATPGTANCNRLVKDILSEPVFSVPGGIISGPVTLTLSLPSDAPSQAVIRYTLDGAHPTEESPIYTGSINISDNQTVRAAIFADGYMTPLPTTHSYIFHPRKQTLPIVSLVGDPSYFYDDKIGILVDGSYSSDKENFQYEWRRPINIEYFEVDGKTPINQVIETRLKGYSSRSNPLRSMVIYANKRFVTKRLDYEFFPEQKPGLTDFKSIELRDAGQDFNHAYMRDAVIQEATGKYTNLSYSACSPAIVYLNGVYMGVLNIRERCNEDNIYTNYDGLEDVDVISDWWEVDEGSDDTFKVFKKFYNTPGHTYEEYQEYMYTDQFADLMMSATVFAGIDFPNGNIVMWRPTADDGKWGWIIKDKDISLGIWGMPYDMNYLEWLYDPNYSDIYWGNSESGTLLFRNLMETPEFKEEFIDRMAIAMGDYLHPNCINEIIDNNYDKVASEFVYHRELYPAENTFDTSVQNMKTWYEKRVPYAYDMMKDFFNIGTPVELKIDMGEMQNSVNMTLNNIPVYTGKFDGKWFAGRRLALNATDPSGVEEVKSWRVITTTDGVQKETTYPGATLDISFPSADSVLIESVTDPAGIDEILGGDNQSTTVEWFDLQGRSLGNRQPQSGIYLRKSGTSVTKVVL